MYNILKVHHCVANGSGMLSAMVIAGRHYSNALECYTCSFKISNQLIKRDYHPLKRC